ncbi:MAG: helix-turn-helix domain-containing protein [Flavobacteriaceae bacterium]|nr:helix-turn-helix domain-containing protein [Flavobacteriaceae bacterium]
MPLTSEEKEFVIALGKHIVSIRKKKGFKQKEIADLLDIADSSLRRIEYGKTNPTTSTLFGLVKALDIDFSELFEFTSTKKLEK